jgi:hypothetical protein
MIASSAGRIGGRRREFDLALIRSASRMDRIAGHRHGRDRHAVIVPVAFHRPRREGMSR